MASPLSKTSSSIGVASTSTLQPTNTAQASGLASLITVTATPTLMALGSPHASSPLSRVSPSALLLQADVKVSSEIDTLVALGKTGGTIHASMDEIRVTIAQKIQTLRESAKDPYKLTSVRSDLCKLSRISNTHYRELKEEIFNLLIHLIEEDPILPQTADGILEIVIELNADLALSKAQVLTILFQKKLARAFSAAVELYLRHYNMPDHVNAVMEDQKKALLETQGSFSGLNTKENVAIEFANQMALEASKRLTSDSTVFMEVLQRLTHLATAIGNAYNTDISAFISELGQAFQGLDNKFKEKWFEALFMLRDLVQKAPDNMKKVIVVQTVLTTKKESYDWKFIYGALEILDEVVSQTQDADVLEAALFGKLLKKVDTETAGAKSTGNPIATAALSAAVAQLVAPRIPGVVDFLEFKGFVEKAFVSSADDKKADSAIKAKAKELCTLLTQKLSATYQGRKLMLDLYLTAVARRTSNDKAALQVLGNIIPTNPKMHKEWLGIPTPLSTKEPASPSHSPAAMPPLPLPMTPPSVHKQSLPLPATTLPLPKPPPVSVSTHLSPASLAPTAIKINETIPVLQKLQENNEKDVKQVVSVSSVGIAAAKEAPISDFHQAVIKGDLDGVQKYISQSKELINTKDSKGNTSLILAAREGHLKMCELLIKAGARAITRGEHFRNALHNAAAAGRVQVVQLFASEKALLNTLDDIGRTPLMLAAEQGHTEVCRILIDRQADVETLDQKGLNVLHIVASSGRLDIVNLLIEHLLISKKISLDTKDTDGNTALILATKGGHQEVCQVLLKSGADHTVNDLLGNNALHWAIKEKNIPIVEMLMVFKELLNSKTKQGSTPLIMAATSGLTEICEGLLSFGADPDTTDENGSNAMHWAAYSGKTDTIRLLSAHKQLIDSKAKTGITPLMFAAQEGQVEAYEALLKAGANQLATSESNMTTMHLAAFKGQTAIVRLLSVHKQLLDSKATNGQTPLIYAADQGHQETCEMLLKAGADPFTKSIYGCNAMHLAASSGKTKIVSTLSVYKQLVDSRDTGGNTPLILAAGRGYLEVCELLLKAGADPLNPLATTMTGMNAMHTAAQAGKTEIVRLLSTYRPLINSMGGGYSPLMCAAIQGHLEVCQVLLEAGADPLATDNSGCNAMHMAARSGKTEVVRMLSANKQLIDAKNERGCTPLISAVYSHLEVCEVLLKAGANPLATDATGMTAIQQAKCYGQNEIVKLLSTYAQQIDSKK